MRVWWTLDEALHGKVLRKIILKKWGTWESNPGPCVYHVNALPVVLLAFFDNIMGHKYYNEEIKLMI